MSPFFEKIANARPYIIAEIGVNHEGNFEKAIELIRLAKEGGSDAAKFQTYKAEKIASRFSPAYWDLSKEKTKSQFELFKKYDSFGPDEYKKLAKYCNEIGIDFMSTPFDNDAVDFLDELMPCFKIASADITNVPLLRKIATKGKPILLSTGAANLSEIDFAIDTLAKAGVTEVSLLHCVLNYPTPDAQAHLEMITGLKHSYPNLIIGYSDHTVPDPHMTALTTAWLLGAQVIEKHFTFDKTLPGNDHYHSMDSNDCKIFRDITDKSKTLRGAESFKHALSSEEPARQHARRSIVPIVSLKKGETLQESNLTYKRPAHGISPVFWDDVIGRTLSRDIEEDMPLKWTDIE